MHLNDRMAARCRYHAPDAGPTAFHHEGRFVSWIRMLEDGALTWADQYQMAEERRSALIARGSAVREVPPRESDAGGRRAGASSGAPNVRLKNIGASGQGGPRPCVYYNNGQCLQRAHHTNIGTLWKHVCRRCWAVEHVEKDCPLGSSGSSR
jgi:hypothetical protein